MERVPETVSIRPAPLSPAEVVAVARDGAAVALSAEAESDGRPSGFAFLEHVTDYFSGDRHGHLGMIAVAESAEGQGVGTALLSAAEDWARTNRYARITLNVFEGNERARRVYENAGYRVETLRYVKLLG